jgi:hypothetical protein
MTCSKCSTEAIKNTALGKDFFYCRQCKEEVIETEIRMSSYGQLVYPTEDSFQKQIDDIFRAMTSTGGL